MVSRGFSFESSHLTISFERPPDPFLSRENSRLSRGATAQPGGGFRRNLLLTAHTHRTSNIDEMVGQILLFGFLLFAAAIGFFLLVSVIQHLA
jgi:hypothetical protein